MQLNYCTCSVTFLTSPNMVTSAGILFPISSAWRSICKGKNTYKLFYLEFLVIVKSSHICLKLAQEKPVKYETLTEDGELRGRRYFDKFPPNISMIISNKLKRNIKI